jgi:hypothetical protein
MTSSTMGALWPSYAGCSSPRLLLLSEVCVGRDGTPEDSNDSSYGVARQGAGPRMFAAFDP